MRSSALQIFVHRFKSLTDPRLERKKLHDLFDIIVLSILAVICGAEGYTDIEQFGKVKKSWLQKFLDLKHGIPSHDTIRRVFCILDASQLQIAFSNWMKDICRLSKGEVIAIDGKTVRRSFDKKNLKGPLHLVSAWANENGVALGQVKTNEKSNEITAIPELIKLLDLEGVVVTIDAMGTQKSIAKQIIEKKADYVLALKGNQSQLHKDVAYSFERAFAKDFDNFSSDYFEENNKAHGRVERRQYWTLSGLDWLGAKENWPGLKAICLAKCTRQVGEKVSVENRYYISSIENNAKQIGKAVRYHWAIENNLHWSLDVCFREDDSRIRKLHGPENFAILRKIAINLCKRETKSKTSIKAKRKLAGWDNSYLEDILMA